MIPNLDAILEAASRYPHYLGKAGAAENSVWRTGPDGRTEYLVPKDASDTPTTGLQPTILKAIFQIQNHGFFATPDFKFNPHNMPDWMKPMGAATAFRRGDMSFLVGAVPESEDAELHRGFLHVAENMEAIRRSVLPRVSHIGCYSGEGMNTKFKVSHSAFEERPSCRPADPIGQTSNNEANDTNSDPVDKPIEWEKLDLDVDSPFRITSLLPLVSPACLPLLRQIIPTTRFNPLPAVLEHERARAIAPGYYQSVLCGAIIELSFTLSHKFISRPGGKVSFFRATVDEIVILQTAATIPLAPSKASKKHLFSSRTEDAAPEPDIASKAGPSKPNPAKRTRKA